MTTPGTSAIPPARLVVVETVSHIGEEIVSADSRFSRNLESDEQPFSRKVYVGQDWAPLECGWIKEASMLVLECIGAAPIQLGTEVTGWTKKTQTIPMTAPIMPGESIRLPPHRLDKLRICSMVADGSRYQITLFPS